MKHFYCRLENSFNVKIRLLLNNIAFSLSRIANTDEIKEKDILNCKFRVKPSLFRVFGKKGKAIAIDQERKFFVIEIACPGINNYDNGFSFFSPKFKISSSFRIEAWTTDFGILRLLVEQVDSSDSQFGILVKTGAICFAFSFDIRKQIISDVQTIYMTPGNFKILDVQTVLGLPNIAHENSFRKK